MPKNLYKKLTKETFKEAKKMAKKRAERSARKSNVSEVIAKRLREKIPYSTDSQTPEQRSIRIVAKHSDKEGFTRPPEDFKQKKSKKYSNKKWSLSEHLVKNKPKSPSEYNPTKRQVERGKRLAELKKQKNIKPELKKQKTTSRLKDLSLKEDKIKKDLKKIARRKKFIKIAKKAGKGIVITGAAAGATGGASRIADALFSVEKAQAPDLPKSEQKKKKLHNKIKKAIRTRRLKNVSKLQ